MFRIDATENAARVLTNSNQNPPLYIVLKQEGRLPTPCQTRIRLCTCIAFFVRQNSNSGRCKVKWLLRKGIRLRSPLIRWPSDESVKTHTTQIQKRGAQRYEKISSRPSLHQPTCGLHAPFLDQHGQNKKHECHIKTRTKQQQKTNARQKRAFSRRRVSPRRKYSRAK